MQPLVKLTKCLTMLHLNCVLKTHKYKHLVPKNATYFTIVLKLHFDEIKMALNEADNLEM